MAVFKKLNVKEEVINRIQDNTGKAINQLSNNALVSGSVLTSQALKAGDNTINHKLGKTLSGWFIVRQRGSASIYDKQDGNSSPAQTLILNSSADVTVDIYVF
jgi:predicted RNA binding protein YcfA (HicA-like mRNA interferase family)